MNQLKERYKSPDLAVIIPTKDRPEKVKNILESLVSQTEQCGRIMIIDGGHSVKDIVLSYSDKLPVEYFECSPPGQIRQRNLGISLLDDRTPLVASFDDDIVLDSIAIEKMIAFWNKCDPDTAGVSFNMTNYRPYRFVRTRGIFGMSSPQQGRVLRSGFNIPISPVTKDLRAQWLCGGATVWKKEILNNFINKEISSRWAASEDLMFSYPIGKQFPLYVCADAKVRHEHTDDHSAKKKYKYYGRTFTLWQLYFIESHPEMSRILFTWMIFGQIVGRLFLGSLSLDKRNIQIALGQIEGIALGLYTLFRKTDLKILLNEDRLSN